MNELTAYKAEVSDEMHELKQAVLKAMEDRDQANRLAALAEKTATTAEAKVSVLLNWPTVPLSINVNWSSPYSNATNTERILTM